MRTRLMLYVLGVALGITASSSAMASLSGKLADAHQVPSFVCDRVDVVPDSPIHHWAAGVDPNQYEWVTPGDFSVPGIRNPICARDAGR